ncbi:MerR family transcriptional regulator [Phytohalomonas tamaricis]|uniref:MerR family transcriptional regulator n=1 Tax=Phytohalomonas tamaricis TaxID=2081032 RepID=UPI000D0B7B18|nr:MerR family transcriptional regulator [Phytohalomonas tamaricis]
MTEQVMETAGGPLYPIREVSRLTGVNSVTLRAWERRYGLIQPRRTPKGHRLYARGDIERVQRILQWLNRGVSVSQVSELLDQPAPKQEEALATPPPEDTDWHTRCLTAIEAIEALDTTRLDALFTKSMGLYPVSTAISRLWRPVVEHLEEQGKDDFGASVQQSFFEAFLRTRLGLRLYHGNLELHEPRLLLSRLPADPSMLRLLLMAFTASVGGFHITFFDRAIPMAKLPWAAERCGADAIILVGSQAERTDLIRRQLPQVTEQLNVPLCLSGPVIRIRALDLEGSNIVMLDDNFAHSVSHLHALIS